MRSIAVVASLLLFGIVVRAELRQERALLHHPHDDHHHHHEEPAASARSSQGYGNDKPNPSLPVSLVQEPVEAASNGYPRENPANPLRLDAQGTNKVEVRAESSTQAAMMSAIPGNAGTDYPTFNKVPETKFSCEGRQNGGYFADVEGRCQVFHVCVTKPNIIKYSFLCPNGTLFDQQFFVCNWWDKVNCEESEKHYGVNDAIGVVPEKPSNGNGNGHSGSGANGGREPQTAASVAETTVLNLDYLPPTPVKPPVEPPSDSYLPPNAQEALKNGLITPPQTSYLAPNP